MYPVMEVRIFPSVSVAFPAYDTGHSMHSHVSTEYPPPHGTVQRGISNQTSPAQSAYPTYLP